MYKAFSDMIAFAEKLGEIASVRFDAKDGSYHCRGAEICGTTSEGDEFELCLSYKKVTPNAV